MNVDQVKINGNRIAAGVAGAVVGDVGISLTMDGASELSMTLSDPDGRFRRLPLMREAARVTVGDSPREFALVKTSKSGADITLTAEDRIVHLLRRRKGPRKAYRDKITRAQFVRRLVKEAAPDALFVCPELKTKQPVAKGEKTRTVRRTGGGGIPRNATGLTVKGVKATATQKRIAEEIITAAMKYKPPRRALLALLCAATHESVMGTLGMTSPGADSSVGILQARSDYVGVKNAKSIPYNVRRFLVEPWTGTSHGGAIKQANAGRSIGDICTSIQGNATGDVYTQWTGEAERWLDAYNGGGGEVVAAPVKRKRYAFEVGKAEDYWTAIKRLAGEVGWRAFVVGNTFYFIAEPDLFQLRRRIRIGKNTRGVDDVDFDVDGRKRADAATLTGRANAWKAAPGTVATLTDFWGPASGRWLVAAIDAQLTNDDVSVTLKRPAKPKPEPAAQTVSRGRTPVTGEQGAAGAKKVITWLRQQVGVTEGSAKYNQWMSKVGGFDPWCSFFVGYVMRYVAGFQSLPSNLGCSASWRSWSHGTRVSKSQVRPGDILLFIWGPPPSGCPTDHVAIYVGGGRRIGGNESNAVANNPADMARCVDVIRPNYR